MSAAPESPARLLTVPETALALKVSVRSVYRLISERRIATVALPLPGSNPVRISTAEIDAFIARNTTPARRK